MKPHSNLIKYSILALFFISGVFAYESPLLEEISIANPFTPLTSQAVSLYDICKNPALFSDTYKDDYIYYSAGFEYKDIGFRRQYDPEESVMGYGYFYARKVLDSKTSLAASTKFSQSNLNNMNRSLEKDFYANYFSYSDTTVGNVQYNGPELWFLLNRDISDNITTGIQLNYGIEGGLKDVYTQCETTLRNLDVTLGLSARAFENKILFGLSGKYLNNQGEYEAVKELQDAFVRTFYGYNIFTNENARSVNRKNLNGEGYVASFQFKINDLFIKNFSWQNSMDIGTERNKVSVGSTSLPTDRGAWVRNSYRIFTSLAFSNPIKKNTVQVYYELAKVDDWAEGGKYSAIVIENSETKNKVGVNGSVYLKNKIIIAGGYNMTLLQPDYSEYIYSYTFNDRLTNHNIDLGFQYNINSVTSAHLKIESGVIEPYFYWNTDKFTTSGFELGWEQLTVRGSIGLNLIYSSWIPGISNDSIDQLGLQLIYKK